MAKYMEREEVNLELLQELLEMHYDAKMDKEDNEIFLKDLCITLRLDVERSIIQLNARLTPSEKVSSAKILKYTNECNKNFILAKVVLIEFEDENSKKLRSIRFEYEIDYYYGFSPVGIIKAVKKFDNIVELMIEKGNELKVLG